MSHIQYFTNSRNLYHTWQHSSHSHTLPVNSALGTLRLRNYLLITLCNRFRQLVLHFHALRFGPPFSGPAFSVNPDGRHFENRLLAICPVLLVYRSRVEESPAEEAEAATSPDSDWQVDQPTVRGHPKCLSANIFVWEFHSQILQLCDLCVKTVGLPNSKPKP